ncbi:MAG: hypothetical protein KME17_08910 [Cyanosarcina radialis HA8281-LM2]|jgi:hypothetical protein|nr:hypothetical protein [Cyanosarcina radialis HA8281-LM2]
MNSNSLSVTSRSQLTKSKVRASKLLGTVLASGLLLSLTSLPGFAQGMSSDTPQQKTVELVKKCQEKFGPNSENPDKESFKKCLKRVLRACVRHTDNPQLCKQWIKNAL